MTTLRDAQAEVDTWVQTHGGYWDPFHNLARLTEEVGEVARALGQTRGPKPIKAGEAKADLAQELGDVLWITMCLANQLDVDLEKSFQDTLQKLGKR